MESSVTARSRNRHNSPLTPVSGATSSSDFHGTHHVDPPAFIKTASSSAHTLPSGGDDIRDDKKYLPKTHCFGVASKTGKQVIETKRFLLWIICTVVAILLVARARVLPLEPISPIHVPSGPRVPQERGTFQNSTLPQTLASSNQRPHQQDVAHDNKHHKKRIIKIACVGDSLTRGDIGVTNGVDDYPTQLKELLVQALDDATVVVENFGKNGATALRTVPPSYDRTKEYRGAQSFQPDIFLLGLGTNDAKYMLSPDLRSKHVEDIAASFLSLLESFHKQNPTTKVFLARRPPFLAKDFQRIRKDNMVKHLHPLLERVVANATSRSLLAGTVDLWQPTMNQDDIFNKDGLHLNHKGYSLVARAWFDELMRSDLLGMGSDKKELGMKANEEILVLKEKTNSGSYNQVTY